MHEYTECLLELGLEDVAINSFLGWMGTLIKGKLKKIAKKPAIISEKLKDIVDTYFNSIIELSIKAGKLFVLL